MPDYTTSIETVNLHDLAREEIEAARATGIDPLELAATHEKTAAVIRWIIANERNPQ